MIRFQLLTNKNHLNKSKYIKQNYSGCVAQTKPKYHSLKFELMKALTGSCCSKAIVEKRVGSSSHRNHVHVPDRVEFCFPRNEKRGYNFWFLKLVQNKGIHPVHAVPSETDEVDLESAEPELETADPQAQQTEQTNESKFVRVTFQLQKDCDFGEQFLVVGDDPVLGSWDPLEALPMTWSDGHVWTVHSDLPAGKPIQFKFILKGKGGHIIWQPGEDRIINTSETMNRITVSEDWENAELQEVIEEDQLTQSNEELKVDAEMSNSAENLDDPKEELVSNALEVLDIEASQTLTAEKPVAKPDLQQITSDSISSPMEKPVAIVVENIGSSEDFSKSTSDKKDIENMIQPSESANSPGNDDIIHNPEHNGNATPLKSQEVIIAEGNLFDLEPCPVLVPGLPPLVATTEEGPGEVHESASIETLSEAFESKDQIIPEFSKEQESNDGIAQQEMNATINDEPKLHDNEHEEQYHHHHHLAPSIEDRSNSQQVDGNVLQNDIQWGRETVKKFLTILGFL